MQSHTEKLDLKITDNGMPTGGLLLTCLRQILKFELPISREYFTFPPLYLYTCWGVKVYIKSALKWQEMVGLRMTN